MKKKLEGTIVNDSIKLDNRTKEEFNQEQFINTIRQIALDMNFSLRKIEEKDTPDFVKKIISEENYTKSINLSSTKKAKDVYEITDENDEPFYLIAQPRGYYFVSDNWTKESIDKNAEICSRLGRNDFAMIPSGEPGAFPDHLRTYAHEAFAKRGLVITDPTPPTLEKLEASKLQYEQKNQVKSIAQDYKAKLEEIKQDSNELTKQETHTPITPFSKTPKYNSF